MDERMEKTGALGQAEAICGAGMQDPKTGALRLSSPRKEVWRGYSPLYSVPTLPRYLLIGGYTASCRDGTVSGRGGWMRR